MPVRFLRAMAASALVLVAVACAPAAPTPTTAPSKPTEVPEPAATAAPAKAAEAQKPAATAAPAKAEAKPAASPVAKTEVKPAASPAAKTEAKPAASPAVKAAAKESFDAKAVEDFYKGKTIRILTGSAAGGGFDFYARLVARHMPQYLPGNPNIIVENRPPNLRAANSVYASEPKDGTVIGTFAESQVFYQLIEGQGIEYDSLKFNWLGAAAKGRTACLVHNDTDVKTIQDTVGGKELIIGTNAPGSNIHDVPTTMKTALGANLKIVPGYTGGTSQLLVALERKEIDGFCSTYDSLVRAAAHLLEGSGAIAHFAAITGTQTPKEPFLEGVPASQSLAKTDEARALLKAVESPEDMAKPYAVAPEVPRDRVVALSQALWSAFNNPQMIEEGQKARQEVIPSTREEVTQTVKDILSTPPAVAAKLKEILK